MPAFRGKLTDEQIWNLVNSCATLEAAPRRQRSGTPPDRHAARGDEASRRDVRRSAALV